MNRNTRRLTRRYKRSETRKLPVNKYFLEGEIANEQNTQLVFANKIRKIIHIIYSAEPDNLLPKLNSELSNLLEAQHVVVYIFIPTKKEFYTKLQIPNETVENLHIPAESSLLGYVLQNEKILKLPQDISSVPDKYEYKCNQSPHLKTEIENGLFIPMKVMGNPLGVLQILNKKEGFNEKEINTINETTQMLALSIYNHYKLDVHNYSKYDLLIVENIVSHEDIAEAAQIAQQTRRHVHEILIEKFDVSKNHIGRSLEAYYGVPFFKYKRGIAVPKEFLPKLNPHYLKSQLWVPLRREDGQVYVAINDPTSLEKIDDVKRLIEAEKYYFCVALPGDIIKTVDYFWDRSLGKTQVRRPADVIDKLFEEIDKQEQQQKTKTEAVTETDHIIIRLAHRIISDAYKQRASDIHIENSVSNREKKTVVRFRIDGVCKVYRIFPYVVSKALVARIKIMAELDSTNRLIPQDGKITFAKFGGEDIELRVATLPTMGNDEDIAAHFSFFYSHEYARYRYAIRSYRKV